VTVAVRLWRIATDTPDYEAHDLSGKGAEKTGGRWNRSGRAVVYSSSTASLACLETVVHLNADDGLPLNRFLVRIEVPADVWRARERKSVVDLGVGWGAVPPGKVSLDVGDAWLASQSCALLEIPSVIVPEESNILINPAHPDTARLTATKLRPWFYDGRLI
jgi:RES domain-containing protein